MKNVSLADKVEEYSYMRRFTPEELSDMRIELAEKSILLKGKQEELKSIKDNFKAEMKPDSDRVSKLLTFLHQKAEVIKEKCNVEFEQELGIAIYYNQNGEEVGKRPLTYEERQPTIYNELRKTGTND